jgi:hypothetical protein
MIKKKTKKDNQIIEVHIYIHQDYPTTIVTPYPQPHVIYCGSMTCGSTTGKREWTTHKMEETKGGEE